jgi:hypothetical protein
MLALPLTAQVVSNMISVAVLDTSISATVGAAGISADVLDTGILAVSTS